MFKEIFKKTTYITIDAAQSEMSAEKKEPSIPKGLWSRCPSCKKTIYAGDVDANDKICPKCGHYFRMSAQERLRLIADENTFEEWNAELTGSNPLDFPGYEEKLEGIRKKTGLKEAVVTGTAMIYGYKVVVGVCDARFMMSSMGEAVGEKIALAVERATAGRLPIILFTCSGGARMQEGMISLMQMAKTSAALRRHSDAGLLSIMYLTDPTTGGVTASFAMLGDIILAEPEALIGFAGPRVIEQTIGQKLPEGFQRSEFLLEHGFVDRIVERKDSKAVLGRLLMYHTKLERPIHMGRDTILLADRDAQIEEQRKKQHKKEAHKEKTEKKEKFRGKEKSGEKIEETFEEAWKHVRLSRDAKRPTALDYISRIFRGFIELHGDRLYGDDGAIVCGLAAIGRMPVTVIAEQKGKSTKENIKRNFGMPKPEGYRKALRLMKQAEKFRRPIICFVDTPGAFCGIEAEERGQGEAIARNLFEMAGLTVPVLSIVIGEGGSGGALALAVANEVWMMENATYSVLSPEGFASILWKDSSRAKEAAGVMKITANDLKEMDIIDKVIPEVEPANTEQIESIAAYIKQGIKEFIEAYRYQTPQELEAQRYDRFRKI